MALSAIVRRHEPFRLGRRRLRECQNPGVTSDAQTAAAASSLTWIDGRSAAAVRNGLAAVAPFLAESEVLLNDRVVTDDPEFFQGSAVVGGAYVVKFAWAEAPARRMVHEATVLGVLSGIEPRLPVPRLVAAAGNPAMLVTRLVPGVALSHPDSLGPAQRRRLTEDIGRFLATLHRAEVLRRALAQGVRPMAPKCQADTGSLRARFPGLVSQRQFAQVLRFCDFADDVLAVPAEEVLLHGDLHGFNLVLDPRTGRLLLVADFEAAGVGDVAFDFRYLPAQARGLDFFEGVVSAYEAAKGARVDVRRVLAWHIRTVLGDALWRSEAGVPLPFGGTPSVWVAELADRFEILANR
jgi:aminoglycoside phosphotransferase (APT) family kinase protein